MDSTQLLIPIIKFVVVAVSFGIAAVSDWIKREINPLIWVPPIAVGIVSNVLLARPSTAGPQLYEEILTKHFYLSVAVSIGIVVAVAVMSFIFSLVGGADALALLSFVSVYPSSTEVMALIFEKNVVISCWHVLLFLPPVLAVLIMYLFIIIPYIIANTVHNILHMNEIRGYSISFRKKVLYIFLGKIVRVKDIAKKRFYYPLYIPGIIERVIFDINEDDKQWADRLSAIEPDTAIIVAWGIPMVTFLGIAAVSYAILHLVIIALVL